AAGTGCGQRGPLFLPGDAAASARATLPQTLRSGLAFSVPDRPLGVAPPAAVPSPGVSTTPVLTAPLSVPGAAAPLSTAPASVRPLVPATP
ncbi:MAG: hypothetical protein KAY08_02760, partial [Giesbergeria sp.]|nr:hypothetical protein [Giesbergeria sp.]